MTTLFEIIRAEKTNVKIGDWKTGKIVGFPLNKTRTIPVGVPWQWRLVEFDVIGLHCRVLIRLNEDTARYQAVLAVDSAEGLRVLCHHELHIGEKGWHCHFCACNVPDVFPGVLRDKLQMRGREMEPSRAESTRFTVTKATALTKAADRFRFRAQGELV